MATNYTLGSKNPIQIRWSVLSTEYSKEKADELRRAFARKHNLDARRIRVKADIIPMSTTMEVNTDDIKNIRDPRFQQQVLKRWFKENNIKDCNFDEILVIDGMVNSRVDYRAYENSRSYRINYITNSNFMTYGDNQHVPFNELNGLVLIEGKPANQCGKSTFADDLIHFALFGKPKAGRADTLAGLFNKNRPDCNTVKVEIGLEIDGLNYIIRRTLTRPELGKKNRDKASQKVEYYRVENGTEIELLDDENTENMGSLGTAQTNKIIKQAIGNEKDFDFVVSATPDNLKELIGLKQTERDKTIMRYMGLDILQEKDVIARELWNKQIRPSLIVDQYKEDILNEEISILQKDNADLLAEKETAVSSYKEAENEITENNKKRDELLLSKKNIDDSLMKYDIHTLQVANETITQNGILKKNQINERKAKVAELGEIDYDENEYKDLTDHKVALMTQINTLGLEAKNTKATIETLKTGEFCPVCGKKLDNVDNSLKIRESEEKYEEIVAKGIKTREDLNKVTATLEAMEKNRTAQMEKNRLELQIARLEVETQTLRNELLNNRLILKGLEENNAVIEHNNKVDAAINIVNANIQAAKNIQSMATAKISSIDRDIAGNDTAIKQRNDILARLKEDLVKARNWQCYLEMIGKNGISKMVLRTAIPLINERINTYLDGTIDFQVAVEMNEKNEIEFNLIKGQTKVPLSTGSGYEQTQASLALRATLGCVSSLPKSPYLIFDEVLGGVAAENYELVRTTMERIAKDFPVILQITHLKEIKPWHNQVILISKDEQGIASIALQK